MRILLTGGTGMVGKNFLENHKAASYEVLAPSKDQLNLCDIAAVRTFFRKWKPDLVIHAAGRVGGIQANINHPVDFFYENIEIGCNLVRVAYESGVEKLINLGSSCMYPCEAQNPLREDMIMQGRLEPTNEGYALAKIAVARLCSYIKSESPRFNYKTLIPCNLYGRFDNFDPKRSHLIPAIIHKLHYAQKNSLQEVSIWGDGSARREFMFAGDLADAIWQAVDCYDDVPDVVNLGMGADLSVREYYEAVAELIGYQGSFSFDLSKPVGTKQKLLSNSLAKLWGWEPKFSLKEGLFQTYNFYLKGLNEC